LFGIDRCELGRGVTKASTKVDLGTKRTKEIPSASPLVRGPLVTPVLLLMK